jgi:hypothetical protein
MWRLLGGAQLALSHASQYKLGGGNTEYESDLRKLGKWDKLN